MPGFYELMRKLINDPAVQIVPTNRNTRPGGVPSHIDTEIYHAIEAANRKVYNVPTNRAFRQDELEGFGLGLRKTADADLKHRLTLSHTKSLEHSAGS